MITLIDTYNLTLDYIPNSEYGLDPFRLTVYDKNGHYLEEIRLNAKHISDLKREMGKLNTDDIDEDFDDE